MSQADGIKYFKLQYGETAQKQLRSFIKYFGQLPTIVRDNNTVKKAFVTPTFIEAFEHFSQPEEPHFATKQKETVVNLGNQGLHQLPSNLGKNAAYGGLYVRHNQLTSLPSWIFTQLPKLYDLDIAHNPLTISAADIPKLKKVKRNLYLDRTQLLNLPKEFSQLKLHLVFAKEITLNDIEQVIEENKLSPECTFTCAWDKS